MIFFFRHHLFLILHFGLCSAAPASSPSDNLAEIKSVLEARDPQLWGYKNKPTTEARFTGWATGFVFVNGVNVAAAKPTPAPSEGYPWGLLAPLPTPLAASPLDSWASALPGIASSAAPFPSPLPVAPVIPAAPAAPKEKKASLQATTTSEYTYCRKWPDTISSDGSSLRIIASSSQIEVNCWTSASMEGELGKVQNDPIWLRTSAGCYIHEKSLEGNEEYQGLLKQCENPRKHWVGVLQEQYKREDCYLCPSQDCSSQNLGVGPYIDVDCWKEGDVVAGNSTWFKQVDQSCYYPGGVFAAMGWLGTRGGKCS